MAATQGVTVLGSTGSIGLNTLDVLDRHPDQFRVVALTARDQIDRLAEQCRRYRPQLAVMADAEAAQQLQKRLRSAGLGVEVATGTEGLEAAAAHPDTDVVMAAIVGAAGLMPILAAVRAVKRVLVANKEPLVMLGGLLRTEAKHSGAVVLPIDSEHNAIFQCLPGASFSDSGDLAQRGVRRIILTGSGGPFRDRDFKELAKVTPEQACAHPNWVMGRKISVDSATMMNKGLEIIEACWLFSAHPDQIEVVVHPQSVVHSLVEYVDGSMLAQLASPDMRVPIAHALAWPARIESGAERLDLCAVARLDFEPPRPQTFPCLALAQDAARAGGTAPAVLNAANEVAVEAFLTGRLQFTQIPGIIAAVMDRIPTQDRDDLESVLATDEEARSLAQSLIQQGAVSDWAQRAVSS